MKTHRHYLLNEAPHLYHVDCPVCKANGTTTLFTYDPQMEDWLVSDVQKNELRKFYHQSGEWLPAICPKCKTILVHRQHNNGATDNKTVPYEVFYDLQTDTVKDFLQTCLNNIQNNLVNPKVPEIDRPYAVIEEPDEMDESFKGVYEEI